MYLAQATNATVNTPQVTVPSMALGFTPTQLVLGLIILAAIIIAVWAIANAGGRGYEYGERRRVVGTKGGRVKRVIEYDDADETDV